VGATLLWPHPPGISGLFNAGGCVRRSVARILRHRVTAGGARPAVVTSCACPTRQRDAPLQLSSSPFGASACRASKERGSATGLAVSR
jgi:hypothetical protein